MVKNSNINQSLVNAFKILECFNENSLYYVPRELSEKLKISLSSTWRLITTLEQIGYLYKKEGNRYCLALKHLNFARVIINSLNIRRVANPLLKHLADELKFNVSLGVLDKEEAVYLDRIPSPDIPDTYFHIGRRVPVYCTALGKVLLAFQSHSTQEEIIRNIKPKKYTQNTIIDKDILKKEIKDTYLKGYAIDNGEFINSVKCLAMPIYGQYGDLIAAISISNRNLINNKKEKNILDYTEEVFKTVNKISNGMGYSLYNPY